MIDKEELQPVFLLGAGRSGTKFLRDILGESSSVLVIPYDVGYVWRYGNEEIQHDEFQPEILTQLIKTYIRNTLPNLIEKKSTKTSASILIEKSVPNSLRPAFLQAVYPDAKFIHLIRDGRAVSESAVRLWKKPPEKNYLFKKLRYFPWRSYRYAIQYVFSITRGVFSPNRAQQTWGPRYEGIDEDVANISLEVVCARQWKRCVETSLSQLSNINLDNQLEIRYEDLMSDSSAISRVCDFLEIKDKEAVVAAYEIKVDRTNNDKWKDALSQEQLELINNELGVLNAQLNYL